jgi:opacity protein-like surface antigen
LRNLSISLLVFLGIPQAALAADLPAANFGTVEELRLTRQDWSGINGIVFFGGGFMQGSDSLGLDAFFRSGSAGGSVGYSQQFNRVVFGADLEGTYANFNGSTRSGNARQSANWLGAATVRMGYDAGRFMPYVSAGIGFGNYEIKRNADGISDSNTHLAFVAGAGVEARISQGLFLRADYKHYEFEDKEYQLSGFAPFTASGQADMFNLGLGYRF